MGDLDKYYVRVTTGRKGCRAYLIERGTHVVVTTGHAGGYYQAIVDAFENTGLEIIHAAISKEIEDESIARRPSDFYSEHTY